MPDKIVFVDKARRPDPKELARVLGKSAKSWDEIKKHISDCHGAISEEWKFYSAKSGWQMKALLKKRNLFFLTPLAGLFRLIFIFGDRAVAAVEQSDLPKELKKELRLAVPFSEGRGLRVEVRTARDVEIVKKLIDIKVGN